MRLRDGVSPAALVCCAMLAVTAQTCAAQTSATKAIDPHLKALADTERAFAKLGAQVGVHESFLQYFTEDGIWFVPGPSKTSADLRSRPSPTGPPKRQLQWAPMYGDVSRAGDLGYSTGPSATSDLTEAKTPTRHGYFFSIWKRQANGEWRVVLDLGVQTPDVWDPRIPPEFHAAPPSGFKPRPNADIKTATAALLTAERAFSQAAQSTGVTAASGKFLDQDARLYRNDISPVIGRDKIRALLAKKDFRPHWEPMARDIAKSADLGYTYGRYWAPGIGKDGAEETGYYVHVWRKDARGDWKLVFHVTSPAPLDKK